MAKVEMDPILDPSLENSGEDDEEIIGMVEDGPFGSSEPEKKLMDSSGEEMSYSNYYNRDPSGNAVAYRLVMASDDTSGNESLQSQSHYTTASVASNGPSSQSIPAVLSNSGQLFVIGNSEMFNSTNKHSVVRDTGKSATILKKRDDRRRATHNEVERRRRDKINNWIIKLAKLIPRNEVDKIAMESKGGILASACDYIIELKEKEERLEALETTNKKMAADMSTMMAQLKALKRTNAQMKELLNERGIQFNIEPSECQPVSSSITPRVLK